MSPPGIHHVTAIAGPARRNRDVYTRILGLSLVKRTVNFDDPSTLHLYYGDADGRPGTILTFFPWQHAAPGRPGAGETTATALRVPAASLGWWRHRLREAGLAPDASHAAFGEAVLSFRDPDGMGLALVGADEPDTHPAIGIADVPAEHAVRGVHGVTLTVADGAGTAAVLTDVLGFTEAGRDGSLRRFSSAAAVGRHVTLRVAPELAGGRTGAGTVHHVAFRAADDAAQRAMVAALRTRHGLAPTEQKDRTYFRSVYFREPGGVLFEIATDGPGFAVDERADALGRRLSLPPGLEGRRSAIEAALPPDGAPAADGSLVERT